MGGNYGFGTIFRMTLAGPAASIYSFCKEALCPTAKIPSPD